MQPSDRAAPPADSPARGGRGFLANVIWGWAGVGATITVGLVFPPFIIRTLGAERYGVWTLVFSVIDYFRLFDLGFRAAIINYCARGRATGDYEAVNEVLNTGLFYFVAISAAMLTVCVVLASDFAYVFHISGPFEQETTRLVVIVAISLAISLASSPISGALEAFQHFDLVNRAYIITLYARTIAWALLLVNGYGLIEMGYTALACQVLERAMNIVSLRRIFPDVKFSFRHAHFATLKGMSSFGIHSFFVSVANLITNQSTPALIGYFASVREVAYFNVPLRILLYIGEIVPRVGYVTASKTAELEASGRVSTLRAMAVYTNRYCYMLFVPVGIFLVLFRYELIGVWINADFAAHSAPLIPVLAIGIILTMAGQFNSGAILIGQGKHRVYSYGLIAESVLLCGLLCYTIPHYGLIGAAYTLGLLMIVTRGLFPAWLISRYNGISLAGFLASVYLMPTAIGLPVAALAVAAKRSILPGHHWPSLIAAAACIECLYMALALPLCVLPDHRRMFLDRIADMWKRRGRPAALAS